MNKLLLACRARSTGI